MCTKTMEQSIDMIVESAILQSPERRRSLLCKESEEKAQLMRGAREKISKRKLNIGSQEKENENARGENTNIQNVTEEGIGKRRRKQVKAFSPRFKGKHLDCTAQ